MARITHKKCIEFLDKDFPLGHPDNKKIILDFLNELPIDKLEELVNFDKKRFKLYEHSLDVINKIYLSIEL